MNILEKYLQRMRYRITDFKKHNLLELSKLQAEIKIVKDFMSQHDMITLGENLLLQKTLGTSHIINEVPKVEILDAFTKLLYESNRLLRVASHDKCWVLYSFELPIEVRQEYKTLMFTIAKATRKHYPEGTHITSNELESLKLGKNANWEKPIRWIKGKWELYTRSKERYILHEYFIEIYEVMKLFFLVEQQIEVIKSNFEKM